MDVLSNNASVQTAVGFVQNSPWWGPPQLVGFPMSGYERLDGSGAPHHGDGPLVLQDSTLHKENSEPITAAEATGFRSWWVRPPLETATR